MKALLVSVFFAIGGMGLLFGLAGKYAPEFTAKGIAWLLAKFPSLKKFVHDNLSAIKALEDAELAAIEKAEDEA